MGGTLHPPPQPCLQVITPSANRLSPFSDEPTEPQGGALGSGSGALSGLALGYRLPPLRGAICDLAAWWRRLSWHTLRWPIHGRLAWPPSVVSRPLVTKSGFVSKSADNSCLHPNKIKVAQLGRIDYTSVRVFSSAFWRTCACTALEIPSTIQFLACNFFRLNHPYTE
jgi:hypothetical protein